MSSYQNVFRLPTSTYAWLIQVTPSILDQSSIAVLMHERDYELCLAINNRALLSNQS